MYLNSFSVRVEGGSEKNSGYVELTHGQQYTLTLRNDRDVKCDAYITIDGKDMGAFRVNAHSSLRLERPENEQKRFTFYKRDSQEGHQSQLCGVSSGELGLVSITFKPENKPVHVVHDKRYTCLRGATQLHSKWNDAHYLCDDDYVRGIVTPESNLDSTFGGATKTRGATWSKSGTSASYCATPNYEAGGTGLSGHSSQQFTTVNELNYDESQTTTINLRLVCKEDCGVSPLVPVMRSNPVPPPIG